MHNEGFGANRKNCFMLALTFPQSLQRVADGVIGTKLENVTLNVAEYRLVEINLHAS